MLLRPNGNAASVLTVTQFAHEWATYLEEQGWDMADGGRGRPSYPADADAVAAMAGSISRLQQNRHVALYGTAVIGEKKYRQQVVAGFKNEYGLEFDVEEIMFTPGGQFGLAAIFSFIEQIKPGKPIITPRPWYVNHEVIANLYHKGGGTKLAPIDILHEPGHKITPAALEAALAISPDPAAFLFCIPGNPLGNLMHIEDWQKITPILERYDCPIILDEAFAEVVFDKNFRISLLHAAPHLHNRIILMRSGTKALGLPGERLAVQRIPLAYMPHMIEFQSRLIGNCPLYVQSGMAAAIANMSHEKKSIISDYYAANAKYLLNELRPSGLIAQNPEPSSGFYFFADLSCMLGQPLPENARIAYATPKTTIENDVDIAMALMFGFSLPKKTGVAIVPACGFGISTEKGWVRISFSNHRPVLEKIASRLNQVALASV